MNGCSSEPKNGGVLTCAPFLFYSFFGSYRKKPMLFSWFPELCCSQHRIIQHLCLAMGLGKFGPTKNNKANSRSHWIVGLVKLNFLCQR